MGLTPGTKLGPYEIVSLLGAGGMGEVYRARDIRLDRTVAVKIIPSHLSKNPEARQRFEREALAISGLSHANICSLFDVGHQDGIDFLVMEFLEGETLGDRLLKGSLATEKLLKYGQEICAGLESAHKSGVVHRDLKPSNIMLNKTGVKLMDFGLAKSAQPPAAQPSSLTASLNAREDRPLTAEGALIGTFQYMSPEQVEGKEADTRSDIFALGALLYEMATGKRAFEGKTAASVIAAVMTTDPAPISSTLPLSPPALDRVIKTCLAKNPDERFQNVHDIQLELKWIADGGSQAGVPAPVSVRRKTRQRLAWSLAAIASLAALLLAFFYVRNSRPEAQTTRFTISPPDNANFLALSNYGGPRISPDGRNLAFLATSGGVTQLWVRPLDSLKPHVLSGTEGAYSAFWSPDGRNLGFFVPGKLKRVPLSGGPAVPVCDIASARGGSWSRQDTIIFGKFPGEIYQVPASGGQPKVVTRLDASRHDTSHRWPYFLPDGNHFLYMAGALGLASDENIIKVGSLDGKTDRTLFNASSPVEYDSGYLLFVVNKNLMARPFIPANLDFSGDPITVVEDAMYEPMYSNAAFSASGTGVLLYMAGNASNDLQLEALDASGKSGGKLGEPGRMLDPRISPNGKIVAFSLVDPNTGKADIWTQDLASGNRTRITRDPRAAGAPTWSRSGSALFYQSIRMQNKPEIFLMPSNGMGVEQKVWEPAHAGWPDDVTPDSKTLVVDDRAEDGKTRVALIALDQHGQTTPLFETTGANVFDARLSADGHWIAYESDESGKREVYVSAFPKPAGRLQVSSGGGRQPKWRGDGKELYYVGVGTQVIAVELKTGNGSVEVVRRRPLFQFGRLISGYDVFPDGKRFLIPLPTNDVPVPLTLVLNWTADLKK
jgi:serine/threonine protein kinase